MLPAICSQRLTLETQLIGASWTSIVSKRCTALVNVRNSLQLSRYRPSMPKLRNVVAQASAAALDNSSVDNFSDSGLDSFTLCVLGDLHLQPKDMDAFEVARQQMVAEMKKQGGDKMKGGRVVQLGDVGGYRDKPGSRECFSNAGTYLEAYGVPFLLVVGNHDLEGEEFMTDIDNLTAWQQSFRQCHYWRADVGPAVLIGLSTTRYRSNNNSVHEIHIDDDQLRWFGDTLRSIPATTPVIVMSHAPPLGSGLKVLNDVHVKNRCAWLNHSSNPSVFMEIVKQHKNIKLWFSGHFHLSHNYHRSISVQGSCAFVTTGVIGSYHRDGYRQSRMIKGNADGYELYTLDHGTGAMRLDLRHDWNDTSPPTPIIPSILLDTPQVNRNENGHGSLPQGWVQLDSSTALAVENNILVEYDVPSGAPIGVVSLEVKGASIILRDVDGNAFPFDSNKSVQGSKLHPKVSVVAIELQEGNGDIREIIERNGDGGWYHIFQPNKWQLKYKKLMQSMDSEMDDAMKKVKFVQRQSGLEP